MLYCAYTCDYVIFSSFSQASRNFLANFREGARKSLNRAENRGGLGIIRDDSGSIRKVLKTVCPKGTGVRIPLPAPNKRTTEPKKLGCFLFLWHWYERILTPICDSQSRRMGFAFERKPSGSLLASGGAKNLRQRRIPLFQACHTNWNLSITILIP